MSKYIILTHTMREPDQSCDQCGGSGSMYGCDDVYVDCYCICQTDESTEQYSSKSEVDLAIEKLQMLDKLSGTETEYEWEII